jgi:uncharacterized protein YceH (UPF0502 family)
VVLNPIEVRVLGSLIEKEITTPDYYPLTLNALTLACNQSSNREPVVSFDESTVVRALDGLREKKWAFLYGGGAARVPRYGHKLNEVLPDLGRAEIAVLCGLMLRGPQTVGEVRTRTARMHEFGNLAETEALLEALASRAEGALVAKLPRQTGFKEQRYAQLLGETPENTGAEAGPAPEAATVAVRAENEQIARLEEEIAALRQSVAELREQFAAFRKQFE